jgi:hypothetical protein
VTIEHRVQYEHRADADGHVAQPRREGKQGRAQVEGVEK